MTEEPRERRIELLRTYILPLIDDQLTDSVSSDVDEEMQEKAERILAEEYYNEGRGQVRPLVKLSAILLLFDSFTQMPPAVYGLVFSLTGTLIMLVHADIMGSESIAARAKNTFGAVSGGRTYLDESEARRLAKNTVNTNIGIVWLATGFLLQIVTVWLVNTETFIQPGIWSRLLPFI